MDSAYISQTDQRAKAVEASLEGEKELRQLVDAVPQHIVVLDEDGRRLHANQVVLDYHGLTLEEFLFEDTPTKCFHPEDLEKYSSQRQSGMIRGEPWEVEIRLRRKDGQYRWFLMRAKPFHDEEGFARRWYLAGTDIEERKVAEQELRRLIDVVPQYMCVDGADGNLLYANDRLLDFFGFTLEEAQASDFRTRVFHPDDLERVRSLLEEAISRGVEWEVEARILRKDGQYRWFVIRFNPFRDEQGNIVRWYTAGTDIEDRKQAEQGLRREEDRLRVLLDFTNRLVTRLDLRELLHTVTASVRRVIPCDLVAVFLPGSEPDTLRSFVVDFPESKGFIREELEDRPGRRPIPMEGTLAGMVFRTGKVWTGNDSDLLQLGLKNDPGIAEGFKTGFVLPIVCRDSVLGVLALARRQERVFSQYEVDLLRQVADQAAIAIVNALVTEERKRAEDALRRTEAYLAEAQRLSHTGSFAHDAVRGEILYWSAETYRTFGFDPAEGPISYREARSRVHPEDLHRFEEVRERGIREKTGAEVDFRIVLPDGSTKHVHCVSRPILNASGEVVELVGTNMDVTEQRQSRAALESAFEEIKKLKDELYRENLALKEEIDQASLFEEIVGSSEPLRRVLVQLTKVAPTDSTVLITGETGTGKELIARAIHKRSQRSARAFVSVNCAAIPAALIGSELFGHEKGAFTGATHRRLGRFELAEGGTLFLDEVGDLPAETQIALLRVLQERQLERIGGNQSIAVNVRIIAATNRDLKAAINAGAFRSDLFYRLNVFPIDVPPLRERREDIPLLVEYLTERYASKAGKKIKNIDRRTLELFQAYHWPGNIRELQNVIERAVILCDGQTLSVDEVWLHTEAPRSSKAAKGLGRLGAEQEKELIESALAECGGRVAGPTGAAAKLGIPRSTLETKIRSLRIDKHRFRVR